MIKLGQLLVKGGWCQILAVEGQPDLCAKVLVPKRRYQGSQPDPNVIAAKKYGIHDFLDYEWNNYQKIMAACPNELRKYFVNILGIEVTDDHRRALVMETVRTSRGEIAPNLVRNTDTLHPEFWANLERIRKDVFLANSIDHFGIVPRNILVKNLNFPVFIDFQTGKERYRGQFWLHHPWFIRKKINRCFSKLYKEMGITMPIH